MYKKGFTLAEVLITLGIIGVVAALTLPGLLTDTTSAQIGPKLAKARTTFEQANQALLHEENVDGISVRFKIPADLKAYVLALTNHMKAANIGENSLLLNDGSQFFVVMSNGVDCTALRPGKCMLGFVSIDINGGQTAPNLQGTDIFGFSLWNDGSLRPRGGANWLGDDTPAAYTWNEKCKVGEAPKDPLSCAGHIFENNLQVLYK